jgi:hypothetical protein
VNTPVKLLAFGAILAAAFGGAAAVGAAVGPIDVGSEASGHSAHTGAAATTDLPRGLAAAEGGYRLVLDTADVDAGSPTPFGFTIVDDDGATITTFDVLHERRLHLIMLSRNMIDYLHLHPTMGDDGHWSVDLPALAPGSYRVFADFQPTGSENLTLGADLSVAGDVHRADLPEPATVADVDGYVVTMDGTPAVGDAELSFTVRLDGDVVRTEPYLGAAGHLVAIRSGDLAYLHVHPHEEGTASVVTFTGEFPTAGTYRLFFDFSHDGVVRTAPFTVVVGDEGSAPTGQHEDEH